jgi:hypothetical protein
MSVAATRVGAGTGAVAMATAMGAVKRAGGATGVARAAAGALSLTGSVYVAVMSVGLPGRRNR